jgi:hypothetical protein
MRQLLNGFALATCLVLSFPAVACDDASDHGLNLSYAADSNGGAVVTPVNRGQELAIECDRIGAPGADVNVVMALDPINGETPTGYDAVLLTDEHIGGKAVHFRVPDMPDLVQRTVTVRVYVTNTQGTTACEAGHLRIV